MGDTWRLKDVGYLEAGYLDIGGRGMLGGWRMGDMWRPEDGGNLEAGDGRYWRLVLFVIVSMGILKNITFRTIP